MNLLFPPPAEVQGARGRYRIESFLGRGGFGESYLARAEDGAEVTLKVLRLERLDSWKALDLFEREARTLGQLAHERIPRLVELFVSDGGSRVRALAAGESVVDALEQAPAQARIVLVQTYVPGRSLQSLIDAGQLLDAAAVEQLARDLLDVLGYLHTRPSPVIHRDIKPSNVILDDAGRGFLIDFGAIQTRIPAVGEAGSTMVGTVGYFPHEQILGRAVPASDLYALGMTLLAALTGLPPEKQLHDPATGRVRAPLGLPAGLGRLLDAVLAPAPGARPESARAALDMLDSRALQVRMVPGTLAPARAKVERVVYGTALGGGLGAAGIIHTLLFNSLPESRLVAIAPLWFVPIVFGAAGLLTLPRKRALTVAVTSAVAVLGLFFFLYGIFPGL